MARMPRVVCADILVMSGDRELPDRPCSSVAATQAKGNDNKTSETPGTDHGFRIATCTYNALGQRTRKETLAGTTVYHYDLKGQLIAETGPDGTPRRDYVWMGAMPVAQVTVDGASETLVYLHTDHLNTPRLATDATGVVVWRWEGEAFGATLPDEDPDGDASTTTVELRFPGQYYDQETGLHYNYYRYYDPETGRYITSDPIGLARGVNTYGYAHGNPVNAIDPLGHATVFIWRRGPNSDYGHTAIMTDYGSYLSHHPRKHGVNQLGSKFRTYQQDKALYGEDADFIIYVSLPDELATHRYVENYKGSERYWGPYNNCADAVTNALNAGHLGISNLSHGALDFISYPAELEKALRGVYWTPKTIHRDAP